MPQRRDPRIPKMRGPSMPKMRGPGMPTRRDPRIPKRRGPRMPKRKDPRIPEEEGPKSAEFDKCTVLSAQQLTMCRRNLRNTNMRNAKIQHTVYYSTEPGHLPNMRNA